MTDEEKAESYIRENVCNKERVFGSQSVCSDKAIRECNERGNFCYFAKINRKSFLDGLKASRDEVNKKLRNCVNCKHRPMLRTNKMCQYADICSVDHDRWEMKE